MHPNGLAAVPKVFIVVQELGAADGSVVPRPVPRGLHSSTLQLKLSAFLCDKGLQLRALSE